jgi:agmatine deiminase
MDLDPSLDVRHYRMPAEWAPHEGTVLTWPHRPAIWRGLHDAVLSLFAKLAAELSEVETVHINVPHAEWRDRALNNVTRAGGDPKRLVWHLVDSDDVWARDHGPIFVKALDPQAAQQLAMLDWGFNAWGGKFASELDNLVPREMNRTWGLPRIEPGLVMEGGSLEVNGRGDLLTTESVLLNTNRNPEFDRAGIEKSLKDHLGVQRLHWLGDGLEGDDTDGHIDDMARFVSDDTIVVVAPPPGHLDHEAMAENIVRLKAMRGADGRPFQIVALPVPEPIRFQGEHLPASYANFYLANGKALVPVFRQKTDDAALAILRELLPGRQVIGLDARALVSQYGGIHCITQQIPAV